MRSRWSWFAKQTCPSTASLLAFDSNVAASRAPAGMNPTESKEQRDLRSLGHANPAGLRANRCGLGGVGLLNESVPSTASRVGRIVLAVILPLQRDEHVGGGACSWFDLECESPLLCEYRKSRRFTRRIFSVSRYNSGAWFEGRRTGPASNMSASRPIGYFLGYRPTGLASVSRCGLGWSLFAKLVCPSTAFLRSFGSHVAASRASAGMNPTESNARMDLILTTYPPPLALRQRSADWPATEQVQGFEGRRTGPASGTSTSRPIDFHPGYEASKRAGNTADSEIVRLNAPDLLR